MDVEEHGKQIGVYNRGLTSYMVRPLLYFSDMERWSKFLLWSV